MFKTLTLCRTFYLYRKYFRRNCSNACRSLCPTGNDLLRADSLLQLPHGLGIPQQQQKFCRIEMLGI